MTYNEWRDELKSNLLCVSESERRRVLDYYAEAYADRRDAGFTEREIIEDFGAPYDAAQRILGDGQPVKEDFESPYENGRLSRREEKARMREEKQRLRRERESERDSRSNRDKDDEFDDVFYEDGGKYRGSRRDDGYYEGYNRASTPPTPAQAEKRTEKRGDYTWAFVLLCIIFAVPIFVLIMGMVGITIGFCIAPFAALVGSAASVISGMAQTFCGDITGGLFTLAEGIIGLGVSLILIPLFLKLVKWMWKLFGMLFGWLKRLFSGKEKAV